MKRLIASLSLMLLWGHAAPTQDEKLQELKGVIRALDTKTGTITLGQLITGKAHELSLAGKDLPVLDAVGRPLTLADLQVEMRVTAKIRNETEVVRLQLDGPSDYGLIRSVDPATRRLTFKHRVADKTVVIPDTAKILVAKNEGKLEQLKVGEPVQVIWSHDHKTIAQVQTGKGTNSRDPYQRLGNYYGVLVDVDQARRSVQVMVQSTDVGIVKTYGISREASLRIMHHTKPVGEIGFEQLAKYVKVFYYVDRDTEKIVSLDAELPLLIRRKVLRLDVAARKLTFEEDRKEEMLELAKDCLVWTPKGEGKLADVAANRIVSCALTLDRSRVQLLYLWDR